MPYQGPTKALPKPTEALPRPYQCPTKALPRLCHLSMATLPLVPIFVAALQSVIQLSKDISTIVTRRLGNYHDVDRTTFEKEDYFQNAGAHMHQCRRSFICFMYKHLLWKPLLFSIRFFFLCSLCIRSMETVPACSDQNVAKFRQCLTERSLWIAMRNYTRLNV